MKIYLEIIVLGILICTCTVYAGQPPPCLCAEALEYWPWVSNSKITAQIPVVDNHDPSVVVAVEFPCEPLMNLGIGKSPLVEAYGGCSNFSTTFAPQCGCPVNNNATTTTTTEAAEAGNRACGSLCPSGNVPNNLNGVFASVIGDFTCLQRYALNLDSADSAASFGFDCSDLAQIAERECDCHADDDGDDMGTAAADDDGGEEIEEPPLTPETSVPTQPQQQPYFDLTGGSLQFRSCHRALYTVDLQQQHDSSSMTSTKQATGTSAQQQQQQSYVAFQLCTGGARLLQNETDRIPMSESNGTCQPGHQCQEYVVDIQTYMNATINHMTRKMDEACRACQDMCGSDSMPEPTGNTEASSYCDFCRADRYVQVRDDHPVADEACWSGNQKNSVSRLSLPGVVDCGVCERDCDYVQRSTSSSGYRVVPSQDYAVCKKISDDNGGVYAGPACGTHEYTGRIEIKVFHDEQCLQVDNDQYVSDALWDNDGPRVVSYDMFDAATIELPLSCYVDNPPIVAGLSNNPQNLLETIRNEMCAELLPKSYACQQGSFGEDSLTTTALTRNKPASALVNCSRSVPVRHVTTRLRTTLF